jgi:hypothetical protein
VKNDVLIASTFALMSFDRDNHKLGASICFLFVFPDKKPKWMRMKIK